MRRELRARVGGIEQRAVINVTALAGYLLAKTAAARSRRKAKDWYDIAFVLLHNDAGGPEAAAHAVRGAFATELVGATMTALDDLAANFTSPSDQGPEAYVEQMTLDHDALDHRTLAVDAHCSPCLPSARH